MNLKRQLERWFCDILGRRNAILIALLMLFSRPGFCQTISGRAVGTREFFLAFCCVVIVGIAANAYLVGLIRPGEGASRFQRFWEFSPSTFGGFSWQKLALWSFLSLFMELLMIRWISSEIRIFAYFKNFVLIACFLGFGLGCYLSRRKTNLLLMLLPLLLLTTMVGSLWLGLRAAISQLPSWVAASAGTHFWDAPSVLAIPALAAATAVIVPIFGLLVFFFVPMGQMVGWYLENASNGIVAYSVNVFAALCGIIAYTLLCLFSQPPITWFVAAGALLILLVWRVPQLRWASLATLVLCSGLFLWGVPKDARVYWSPYQKLTLGTWGTGREVLGYYLNTNDSWYQQILDLSPKFV